MNVLKDRTVVVIGGGSGMGLAIAKAAAEAHANLVFFGRSAQKLECALT